MQELKQLILGNLSPAYYFAALFFSALAILLTLLVDSTKRNASSGHTPKKFSARFLLWDNSKRILAALIAMFLLYRFGSSFIGRALSMEAAVAVGFFISMGMTQFTGWLKQRFNLLKMNRKNYLQTFKQQQ